MPVVNVYSPFSGTITNIHSLCAPHKACNGEGYLIDIAAPPGTNVYLYTTYPIKVYISTLYQCCYSISPDYYRCIRRVDLYDYSTNCYVGSVFYGHLDQAAGQQPDGWTTLLTSNRLLLGKIPGCTKCTSTCCCGAIKDPECCFSGPHVHIGMINGQRAPLACWQTVSEGTTLLYSFQVYPC